MKIRIILVFLTLFTLFTFNSCEKDDSVLVGNLKITFSYPPEISNKDIFVYIYFAENTKTALYASVNPDSDGILRINNLNHGNYVCIINWSGTQGGRAFQITAGKETALDYKLSL